MHMIYKSFQKQHVYVLDRIDYAKIENFLQVLEYLIVIFQIYLHDLKCEKRDLFLCFKN
jgi:hypothetical protein